MEVASVEVLVLRRYLLKEEYKSVKFYGCRARSCQWRRIFRVGLKFFQGRAFDKVRAGQQDLFGWSEGGL